MKCSLDDCNKEASYILVDYLEGRCNAHQNLGTKKERELKNEKRKKRLPVGTEVW